MKKHLRLTIILLFVVLMVGIIGFVTVHRQNRATAAREQGTVKWFNKGKGYGFVRRQEHAGTSAEGGEDVLFLFSDVQSDARDSLKEGQQVEFEVIRGPKGKQAVHVEIATSRTVVQ